MSEKSWKCVGFLLAKALLFWTLEMGLTNLEEEQGAAYAVSVILLLPEPRQCLFTVANEIPQI